MGNAFRKSFSIELDWPQSSAWQQIKTLCNRVEVTRGAAKWITSEPFAAAHIRCATINLRRFHFAFIVQRLVSGIESVANVRVNCLHSLCIFQLSNCSNQIHVLTRIASASRVRSARNERYSNSQSSNRNEKLEIISKSLTHGKPTHTRTHTHTICSVNCRLFFFLLCFLSFRQTFYFFFSLDAKQVKNLV